jgi:hypothetical protein
MLVISYWFSTIYPANPSLTWDRYTLKKMGVPRWPPGACLKRAIRSGAEARKPIWRSCEAETGSLLTASSTNQSIKILNSKGEPAARPRSVAVLRFSELRTGRVQSETVGFRPGGLQHLAPVSGVKFLTAEEG